MASIIYDETFIGADLQPAMASHLGERTKLALELEGRYRSSGLPMAVKEAAIDFAPAPAANSPLQGVARSEPDK
jgi:hypothetical protein